ncbi:GNAT family N-acetyltransferase [Nocardia sp. NEAU-G5]|uniref:GNAT family N-acetyltransferase n=1 Tax=Nocardia albiluteola TaxID=2842303 RepID=A0ABS6B0L5_9NOCA|nr:GNAT family N-acetyltransferase [Nocardia albiluteola]MBU3063789.1 GNAT family N-acetyltransferase [Nocardia albiluteola]
MTIPSHPWRIAPLTAEHTRGLAECHIVCWREAYRGLVPDHLLAAFDIERRAQQWERIRAQDPEPVHIALLDDDETVIGFAGSGPSRDDPPVAALELRALYVRAAWYGTGLADDLMRAAIPGISRSAREVVRTAERPGPVPSTHSLWVFEENPRAQAFYRAYGFELDGTRRAERFSPTVEVRMIRRAE